MLHVARYPAKQLNDVIDSIHQQGYGLTFAIHSRLQQRIDAVAKNIRIGNCYVNRNQIGAVVGSQPFGGEGLSGTGPKAGGFHYLPRLVKAEKAAVYSSDSDPVKMRDTIKTNPNDHTKDEVVSNLQECLDQLDHRFWSLREDRHLVLQELLAAYQLPTRDLLLQVHDLPGPTGVLNQLRYHPRGIVLCLGPDNRSVCQQALQALLQGNAVVVVSRQTLELTSLSERGVPVAILHDDIPAAVLAEANGFAAVCYQGSEEKLRQYRQALAARTGAILPLIVDCQRPEYFVLERHCCIDTTAVGGNASLLAEGG